MNPFRYMLIKWVYGYSVPLDVVRELSIDTGSRLLHVGPGIGDSPIMIHKRYNCAVDCIEFDRTLVSMGSRRVNEKGYGESVSYHVYEELTYLKPRTYDAALFESSLSVVTNPELVLSTVAGLLSEGALVGVLELTWNSYPSDEKASWLVKALGRDVNLRTRREWEDVFHSSGHRILKSWSEGIGLLKKFWSDFKVAPTGTLWGISKVVYGALSDVKKKDLMFDFLNVLRNYKGDLSVACFVLDRSDKEL
ncbi:MAG: class I SAM-dependent methyltransferase [Aigarchaeota archaeon]|nr:class I SAM-dependent methyltransferase [Aigarchaeota archaeon]